MEKIIVALLVLVSSVGSMHAQNNNLVKFFITKEDKSPIENVALFVLNDSFEGEKSIVSDISGIASVNLKKGQTYTIGFLHDDYQFREQLITIDKDYFTIVLKEVSTLDEVVIQASKKVMKVERGKYVLDLENEVMKNQNSILDNLKLAPVVNVRPNGGISIGAKNVTVFVNKKELQLSGEELQNYLEGLSPDEVQSIKINTNPNASYDSRIQSVIAIQLKRSSIKNEEYRMATENGFKTNYYTENSFRYKTNRKNFRLNSKISYGKERPYYTSEVFEDTNKLASESNAKDDELRLDVGLDMDLDDRNWLDVSVYGSMGNSDFSSNTQNNSSGIAVDGFSDNRVFNSNLVYLFTKNDSINLDVKLDFAYWDREAESSIKDNFSVSPSNYRQFTPSQSRIFRAAVNKTLEGENGGHSYGLKFSNVAVNTFNRNQLENVSEDVFGDFEYVERVGAGYFNRDFILGMNYLSVGLRGEFTAINTNYFSNEQNEKNSFDYWNFVPNITYVISKESGRTYSFGLGSAISRPSYSLLNPFLIYDSDILDFEGDIAIKAQQSYTFDLGYNYKKHNLYLQLYYSDSFISTYIENQGGQLVSKYTNFENVYYAFLNYSTDIKLLNFWKTYWDASILYPMVDDNRFEVQDTTPNINLSLTNSIKISPKWRFIMELDYSSSYKDGFFDHKETFSLDANVSYRLKNPNLFLNFYATDIFKSYEEGSRVILPNVGYENISYDDVFSVGAKLIFKFGKELDQAKKLEKDVFEELERINK